jgi:hypothetical protein
MLKPIREKLEFNVTQINLELLNGKAVGLSSGTSVPFGDPESALKTAFSSWRARTGDSE